MVFTWGFSDLCIIFRWWHVKSTLSLIISLVAIVAICAGYEALREGIRRYEAMVAKKFDTAPRKCFYSPPPPFTYFLPIDGPNTLPPTANPPR